jgi:replication factor C subunit 2/4
MFQLRSSKRIKRKKSRNGIPWVEKHRPRKLDDIIGHQDLVNMLKNSLTKSDTPHLLLYGPPGTGKTTIILAAAREMYGPKLFNERVLELNASDDRGIKTVRTKIVTAARMAIGSGDPKYPSPPFRLIILDEADAMTVDAQSALRKTMETNSGTTRFCLICNYINKIIEPITSRCVKFRFKPLKVTNMTSALDNIIKKEGLTVKKDVSKVVAEIAEGDMRKAIGILQNLKYEKTKIINKDIVYSITGVVPDEIIEKLYDSCNVTSITKVRKTVNEIRRDGYSMKNVIDKLYDFIINSNKKDHIKAIISIYLSDTITNLEKGANEYLQLMDCSLYIHGLFTPSPK